MWRVLICTVEKEDLRTGDHKREANVEAESVLLVKIKT